MGKDLVALSLVFESHEKIAVVVYQEKLDTRGLQRVPAEMHFAQLIQRDVKIKRNKFRERITFVTVGNKRDLKVLGTTVSMWIKDMI